MPYHPALSINMFAFQLKQQCRANMELACFTFCLTLSARSLTWKRANFHLNFTSNQHLLYAPQSAGKGSISCKNMHEYCVQLAFEQHECYAFAYPLDSMNFKCLFKPMAVIIAVSKTFDHHDGWCNWVEWGCEETTDSKPKNVILFLSRIKGKRDLISPPFLWDVVQNVDGVVCVHAKQHQSAWRWIIFGGICTFCSMLMSKAAQARLPGERRGDGEERKTGREQSGRERNRRRLV